LKTGGRSIITVDHTAASATCHRLPLHKTFDSHSWWSSCWGQINFTNKVLVETKLHIHFGNHKGIGDLIAADDGNQANLV